MSRYPADQAAGLQAAESKNTLTVFISRLQQHNQDLRALSERLEAKVSDMFGSNSPDTGPIRPTTTGAVEPVLPTIPQIARLLTEQDRYIDDIRTSLNRLSDL